MTALLALIPTKDWLFGGLIVLLIIFGVHEHHKILAEGIAKQQAADAKASATLVANTAKQTADLQARATMAEQAFDKEQSDNAAFRSTGPEQPVRLCLDSHNSGSVLSQAGGKVAGNGAAGATPVGVQPMPTGNSGGRSGATGVDIGPMLEALSASADQVSSTLREFQSR